MKLRIACVAAIATLAAAPAALAGGNGNGPDGKVTICHRTGSETNPIVVITISKNALPAHLRHGDGFFFKGKCFFFHKK